MRHRSNRESLFCLSRLKKPEQKVPLYSKNIDKLFIAFAIAARPEIWKISSYTKLR